VENKPEWKAAVILQIPFHDVDSMEVVWHGHYVRYLEIARCALLDKIDYNYLQMKASGYVWPVIDLHIRYAKPSIFNQNIKVIASVQEWENRLKINYLITDNQTGHRLTRASSTQVAVDLKTGEMCLASPTILFQKLGISN
jgi:acyl-CoA thioester hydrolase